MAAIKAGLAAQSLSAHAAAKRGGLPPRSFQSVLEGRSPSLDRIGELCEVLNLELYVGLPRGGPEMSIRDVGLAEVEVALEDAWARIPPHKRAALAEAIKGNIELSCPSEGAEPAEQIIALPRSSGGAA